jgi:hypothetical protein
MECTSVSLDQLLVPGNEEYHTTLQAPVECIDYSTLVIIFLDIIEQLNGLFIQA